MAIWAEPDFPVPLDELRTASTDALLRPMIDRVASAAASLGLIWDQATSEWVCGTCHGTPHNDGVCDQ